jgi:hypothetical protein
VTCSQRWVISAYVGTFHPADADVAATVRVCRARSFPDHQRRVGEHAHHRRRFAGRDRVAGTLEHRDRCGALDFDVLQQPQIPEPALGGEADAQSVRPNALRGSDQQPVDIAVFDAGVGECGRGRLARQQQGSPAGGQRHRCHAHPDDGDAAAVAHDRGFRSAR